MIQLIQKVYAAVTPTLETALKVKTTPTDLGTILGYIANIIGIVAGALAFVMLIYSGIMYLTANGNPDQAKKAQTGIINAVIGIVIIILAYSIFTAIRGAVGGTTTTL